MQRWSSHNRVSRTCVPTCEAAFSSRADLMRRGSSGFPTVVSRMLTRHQHESRAWLRSATSGTIKKGVRQPRRIGEHGDIEMLDSRGVCLRFFVHFLFRNASRPPPRRYFRRDNDLCDASSQKCSTYSPFACTRTTLGKVSFAEK